jgi:hypothetical protein
VLRLRTAALRWQYPDTASERYLDNSSLAFAAALGIMLPP